MSSRSPNPNPHEAPSLQTLSPEEKRAMLAQLLRQQASQAVISYPLSYGQQALWFLFQNNPESTSYNVAFPIRIRSGVDIPILRHAFQTLLDRHPGLRTTFTATNGVSSQEVHKSQQLHFEHIDASGWSYDKLRQEVINAYKRPFDLKQGPLFRVYLFTRAEQDHVLLPALHHIIYDGWSTLILLEEFRELYTAAIEGRAPSLQPLQATYADFVQYQRELLASQKGEQLWDYWQRQLSGELPILNLPTDRPRPAIQTNHGASYKFFISPELTRQLKQLVQQEETTLFTLLLAAFQVFLHRYTGQPDILVGSAVTGREQARFSRVINYFVNMIVLRADLAGNPVFTDFLKQVRQTVLGALTHQEYPFPLLVERLNLKRDPGRIPLFQTTFILRKTQGHQELSPLIFPEDQGIRVTWGALELEYFDMPQEEGQFDLGLEIIESPERCAGIVKYNTDLFDEATIQRIVTHFTTLLQGIVDSPQKPIALLPLISPAEQQQILVDWNATSTDFPHTQCVHELFEEQVSQTPEAIAAVYKEQSYTYEQLNRKANQLAHYLRSLGINPETMVALCTGRSLDMIVGILGILKAGGAYIPVDPSYPQERLASMLNDADPPLLLTQKDLLAHLPEKRAKTICLDWDWSIVAQHPDENPVHDTHPDNLAYVIYTSGSTGIPKGTLLSHYGLLNLVFWHQQAFKITADDKATQLAGISFDASVWEIWPYLTIGATLYLVDLETLRSPKALRDWLISQGITITFLPTPMAEEALILPWPGPEKTPLRIMLTGGDKLHRTPSPAIPFTLVNNYGPTENTVVTTSGEVPSSLPPGLTAPHIGRPISNVQVYVLDPFLQPVPIGVPGELHIGGESLARGYLNRSELTKEKFIPNPFGNDPTTRLYKTGDLVRYLPDGNIEFLGRIDYQVKIRGFRIELGEIEAALSAHSSIREAVVLAREDLVSSKQLVAYYILHDDAEDIASHELRSFLKRTLPEYMIPSAFITLKTWPLTPNGKLDRRALPVPGTYQERPSGEYIAPRTPVEQQLADIWADVLHRDQVSIHDNFFDLGGDSILSIQIVARANQAGLHLNPNHLFQHQTIAELAIAAETRPSIQAEQGFVTGPVPLTPIQHWFFEQSFAEPYHWNQSILLETREPLDADMLEQAAQALVRHHDALRLRFVREQEEWLQECVLPDDTPLVTSCDLSDIALNEQVAALHREFERIQNSLDLLKGPLFQILLVQRGDGQPGYVLLIVHHLAIDGVSWRILLEDLQTAYLAINRGVEVKFPQKTSSFQAWASRLHEYCQSAEFSEEIAYWTTTFADIDVTPLPLDFPDTSVQTANTEVSNAHISVMLDCDQTRALLYDVHQAYNTNINDILLTALTQTLGEWTESSRLLFDLEGHGRENVFDDLDVSRTIGWFTTMFPVYLPVEPIEQPGEALKNIKEHLRNIPRQGFSYGLLRYLYLEPSLKKRLQHIPEAQVSFNYLGQIDRGLADSTLFCLSQEASGPVRGAKNRRIELLEIEAFIIEDQLHIRWTYSQNLHQQATIERLAHRFLDLLQILIAHCQSPEAGSYTPSDFPDVDLDQEQLDNVLDAIDFED